MISHLSHWNNVSLRMFRLQVNLADKSTLVVHEKCQDCVRILKRLVISRSVSCGYREKAVYTGVLQRLGRLSHLRERLIHRECVLYFFNRLNPDIVKPLEPLHLLVRFLYFFLPQITHNDNYRKLRLPSD